MECFDHQVSSHYEVSDRVRYGQCSNEKISFLVHLVDKTKPRLIIEIGTSEGKSLIALACALKEMNQGLIYGIDPWDDEESLQNVVEKINQFQLKHRAALIKGAAKTAAPIHGFDILHIQGGYEDAYLNVTKWVPRMNSGGWIVFDTLAVAEAIVWLNANCIKFAEFNDISPWGVWIKP